MGGHENDSSSPKGNALTDFKLQNLALGMFRMVDGPVTYFRENVIVPIQARNPQKWYHRRFNRVPTVDQCDLEDPVCVYEADQQFYRDKNVDSNIVKFMRQRFLECMVWEGADHRLKCRDLEQQYEEAATNWFIKYGDIRAQKGSIEAYMKQKHRLIWERRHPEKKLH